MRGDSVNLLTGTVSSYSWSSGVTTQSVTIDTSGNYTVMVTDANGCTAISSPVTITVYALPNPTITAVGSTTYCVGSPASYLTTSSDIGYTYQWIMGITPQSGATNQTFQPTLSGTYKVTVTSPEGCSAISVTGVEVTASVPPTVIINAPGTLNICDSAVIVMTALVSDGIDITYQWLNNGVSISEATMPTFNANAAGIYSCIATGSQFCFATSNSLEITSDCLADGGQSIDKEVKSSMMLYPNPASDNIHIKGQFGSQVNGEAILEIRNILGSVTYIEKLDIEGGKFATRVLFDQQWVIGNYFVHITFKDDVMLQQLVIMGSH